MGITHCVFLIFDGCPVAMQNSVFELRKNTGEYEEWPSVSLTSRVITVIIGDSTQGTKLSRLCVPSFRLYVYAQNYFKSIALISELNKKLLNLWLCNPASNSFLMLQNLF